MLSQTPGGNQLRFQSSYNESRKLSERRREFNVPELKRLAAESINQGVNDVSRFEKLAEGGFNRTFLVTMTNGFQLIARIPYPITEPKYLVVASEVATLDYLHLHGIPVPKVHSYSATSDNAAGTEYIFMEYICGRDLGDLWFGLSEKECSIIIRNIVELEARLFSLRFPASGSIYYTDDLRAKSDKTPVPIADPTSNGRFCIGPDTTLQMWFGKRRELQVDRGPYDTPEAVLAAGAKKELAYLTKFGKPLQPLQPIYRELYGYQKQSHLDHMKNLEEYLRVSPYLVPKGNPILPSPTLRHPDLQPNNILVTEDLQITGLIDWQHSAILPLFLQCGIPNSIQNYGDDVPESLETPSLPDNFSELGESDQSEQLDILRRRQIHYYYATYTATLNRIHGIALTHNLSILRRQLFSRASEPWEGDNISLKADLIHLSLNWGQLSNPSPSASAGVEHSCPLAYSNDEASQVLDLNAEQIEADEQLEVCRNYVGVGSEGWLPSDRYNEAKQREMRLKAIALEAADSDEERAKTSENWIFNDFDETEYIVNLIGLAADASLLGTAYTEFTSTSCGSKQTSYPYLDPPELYYAWRELGFNLIRLPVVWGHIQDGLNGPLNETTLAGLDNLVNTITGNGSTVILDIVRTPPIPLAPHTEYALTRSTPAQLRPLLLCSNRPTPPQPPQRTPKDNPRVIFELMNEQIMGLKRPKMVLHYGESHNRHPVPGPLPQNPSSRPLRSNSNNLGTALAPLPLLDAAPKGQIIFDLRQYFGILNGGTKDCLSWDLFYLPSKTVTEMLRSRGPRLLTG
ncbi:Phosphotransferase enzyme, partial [Aspergillus hancockii]